MAYSWMSSNADNAQRAGAISGAFNQGADRALKQRELDARLKEQELQNKREEILFPIRKQQMELGAQSMANQLQTSSIALRSAKDEEAQYGQELPEVGNYMKQLSTASADQIDALQPPQFRSLKARQQAQNAYEIARNTTSAQTFKIKQDEATRSQATADANAQIVKGRMSTDPELREFAVVKGIKNPDDLNTFQLNALAGEFDKEKKRKSDLEDFTKKQKIETAGRIEVVDAQGKNAIAKMKETEDANADKIKDLNIRTQYREMMANARAAKRNADDEDAQLWYQKAHNLYSNAVVPSTPTQASGPSDWSAKIKTLPPTQPSFVGPNGKTYRNPNYKP